MDNYQNEITSDTINNKEQISSYEIKPFLIRIALLIILIITHFLLPITTLKVETICEESNHGGFSSSIRVSPEGDGIMSFSLSKLAFNVGVDEEKKGIYDIIFIDLKENHKSAISTVLAISFICILFCTVFVIKSIFHIVKKNSFKASSSIAMAFIPITLAILSLIILIIAIMNYAQPDSTLAFDIIGKAYPSKSFFILLVVAILTNVSSFKAIPRT